MSRVPVPQFPRLAAYELPLADPDEACNAHALRHAIKGHLNPLRLACYTMRHQRASLAPEEWDEMLGEMDRAILELAGVVDRVRSLPPQPLSRRRSREPQATPSACVAEPDEPS